MKRFKTCSKYGWIHVQKHKCCAPNLRIEIYEAVGDISSDDALHIYTDLCKIYIAAEENKEIEEKTLSRLRFLELCPCIELNSFINVFINIGYLIDSISDAIVLSKIERRAKWKTELDHLNCQRSAHLTQSLEWQKLSSFQFKNRIYTKNAYLRVLKNCPPPVHTWQFIIRQTAFELSCQPPTFWNSLQIETLLIHEKMALLYKLNLLHGLPICIREKMKIFNFQLYTIAM